MLIGPASDGRFWRSASWTSRAMTQSSSTPWRSARSSTDSLGKEVITMRHTENDIEGAAARFEQLADDLDPASAGVEDTDDLRQIANDSEAVRADEARLRVAVQVAREAGRSWNQIALALGVSRQAARQRFTHKTSV